MYRTIHRWAIAALCFVVVGCQTSDPLPLAQAPAGAPQPSLPPSNYELADAGTVFIWRDLDSGELKEEHVKEHRGRQAEATFGGRRSFGYVPDPWADNENTKESDIEPLFPLEVGKKVSFHRQPEAGRTFDTVEVLRTETLTLPFGTVDTYVIETTSKLVSGGWIGKATVWYAPSIRWQVQWDIDDNRGDRRRRQLVEIKQP
jgi:hypothetical protein